MTVDYLLLWLIAAAGGLIVSAFVVVRNWTAYTLPIKLIPLDVLTVILLIDLNIKSNSNITIQDPFMKMEAIAFTCLLASVLFAPVLWIKIAPGQKKSSRRTR